MLDLDKAYKHAMKFHLDKETADRELICPNMVTPKALCSLKDRIEWFYENIDCSWFEEVGEEDTLINYYFSDISTAMAFKLRFT